MGSWWIEGSTYQPSQQALLLLGTCWAPARGCTCLHVCLRQRHHLGQDLSHPQVLQPGRGHRGQVSPEGLGDMWQVAFSAAMRASFATRGMRRHLGSKRQLHLAGCPLNMATALCAPQQQQSTLLLRLLAAQCSSVKRKRQPSVAIAPLPTPDPNLAGHKVRALMQSAPAAAASHLHLVPDVLHLPVDVLLVHPLPSLPLMHHVGNQVVLGGLRGAVLTCTPAATNTARRQCSEPYSGQHMPGGPACGCAYVEALETAPSSARGCSHPPLEA